MGEALQCLEAFYERFAADDMDGATALLAEECQTVTPAGVMNKEERRGFGLAFRAALPDARMEVTRAVESGDEVYVSGRFKGTHSGDLASPQGTIPASGNSIDVPFAEYAKVRGGQIVDQEVIWDQMLMLGQLGALPPAGG